ncbi:MAG: histidinol-phosphate transaminase [Bacteroidaceae bacterium]|nr:histidinol-phosphate transaminase [Prevotellaceae bacterium]MDY5632116.1 histidinol-phosphate transaminase [Bacteroidaceae bacterium]
MKPLQELVRPNIWALTPYSCARDEYKGKAASVFLDANESPYNAPFNRYPDPTQWEVKELLAKIKGVRPEQIFLGNGSDEAIDLVFRVFCCPGKDNVVAIAPTYGMYQVCADINDVAYRPVLLNEDFSLSADRLLAAVDENTKAIFLCTPNNPTGNNLEAKEIEKVITHFDGIVVIDEAYADFSQAPQFRNQLEAYPNIIVLNTMSKAWGSAAIRMGMAFAGEEIIELFNRVKYPYNINLLSQQQALALLKETGKVHDWLRMILNERAKMLPAFAELSVCKRVYPTDANFFLAKMTDANAIYHYLIEQGIVVRNRNSVQLCGQCLRITIGTPSENNAILGALRQYK